MATEQNPQSAGNVTPGGSNVTPPPPENKGQSGKSAEPQADTHKAIFDSLGGAEERILTAKDFEDNAILDHGIEENLHWKRDNNFVVDVSHLTDEARDFLNKDPKIKVKSSKIKTDA